MLCHGVVQSVLISILPRPRSIIKVVPSKAKIVVNFIWRSNPYRTVNTFSLGYTNQSVNAVQGNNLCLFSRKHVNTQCEQNEKFVNVELVEHIVTTGIYSTVCLFLTNHPVYPVHDLGSSVVMELAM